MAIDSEYRFIKTAEFPHALAYKRIGQGEKIMLCFHGFDRTMEDFIGIHPYWQKSYTFITFDLPYHGESENWPYTEISLKKESWKSIIQELMTKEGFNKFSIMGYSLGGRFALVTLELFGHRINSCFLLAPDGLKLSPWYHFVSKTQLGRRLYDRVIDDPSFIYWLADTLADLRIVPQKMKFFVRHQLIDEDKRIKVRQVWLGFKYLDPNLKLIRQLIKEHQITSVFIRGKYDVIIRPASETKFTKVFGSNGRIINAECGHQLFKPEVWVDLAKAEPSIFSI